MLNRLLKKSSGPFSAVPPHPSWEGRPSPKNSVFRRPFRRWFTEQEPFSPVSYRYAIDRVLHRRRTPFQAIQVLEHAYFGRMLVLDNVVQLTERDEFFYHEMLAHVPLHSHPRPESVLIIGGGDGGTLREVLKHPTVSRVTLVEIDPEVIEVSKRFFPGLAGSFSSPAVTVHAADGAEYLRDTTDRFDAILVDGPDPFGPATSLSTPAFYRAAFDALTERGVFAMQTESLHFHIDFVRRVQGILAEIFPWAGLYSAALATYPGNWWSFSMAARVPLAPEPVRPSVPGTRYYCEEVHRHSWVSARVLERLPGAGGR